MLKIKKVGAVIHVEEVSFSATKAFVKHWYYNLDLGLKSSTGCLNSPLDRPMSVGDIQWVAKHYLPKCRE